MLKFKLESKEKISIKAFMEMRLIDMMVDQRHFAVFVDDRIFIDDICLLAREFVAYTLEWQKKPDGDFIYNTIDDEENPLIAFNRLENGWKLQSVWQEFECPKIFSTDEVKSFINGIISQIIF